VNVLHSPVQSSVSTDWAFHFSAVSNCVLLYEFLQNHDLIFKGWLIRESDLYASIYGKCNEKTLKLANTVKKNSQWRCCRSVASWLCRLWLNQPNLRSSHRHQAALCHHALQAPSEPQWRWRSVACGIHPVCQWNSRRGTATSLAHCYHLGVGACIVLHPKYSLPTDCDRLIQWWGDGRLTTA